MLESRWGIIIVTFILAVLLFLNVNDVLEGFFNEDEELFNEIVEDVPVTVKFDEERFYVAGAPQTVSVELFGSMANVRRAQTTREFNVVLDLRNREAGDFEEYLRVENLPANVTAEVLPQSVNVSIQQLITRELEVQAEISETRIPQSHKLVSVTTEPRTVVVSGGDSEMNRIQYVRATIPDTSRITSSQVEEAVVNVFDYQFNRLDVSVNPERIMVHIEVEEKRKEVPISYNLVGEVAENYTITEVELSQEYVEIFGNDNALNLYDELTLSIDVDGLNESTSREIEIEVPESLIKIEPSTITATIEVEEN